MSEKPLKPNYNRHAGLHNLIKCALSHKVAEDELNAQVRHYVTGRRTQEERDKIFTKSLWIPAGLVLARCGLTDYWEIGPDQFQSGSYALLKAIDRYAPLKNKNFIAYATMYVNGAMDNVFSDHLSVVQHLRR